MLAVLIFEVKFQFYFHVKSNDMSMKQNETCGCGKINHPYETGSLSCTAVSGKTTSLVSNSDLRN